MVALTCDVSRGHNFRAKPNEVSALATPPAVDALKTHVLPVPIVVNHNSAGRTALKSTSRNRRLAGYELSHFSPLIVNRISHAGS